MPLIHDFSDTTSFIDQLDLVISVTFLPLTRLAPWENLFGS